MADLSSLPKVPQTQDPALNDYLQRLHAYVTALGTSAQAPGLPTNLSVTPVAGGNVIQFTRSNGITFNLYLGSTPNRAGATQVGLGSANTYTDTVGQGGVARYYWVEALNQQGLSSGITGPKSGTTLALGTPASAIPAVPQSTVQVFDTTLDRNRPVVASVNPDITFPAQP